MSLQSKLYILLGTILICGCNNSSADKSDSLLTTITQQLPLKNYENTILINNPHSNDVSFTLKINDFFPLSIEDMVNLVNDQAKESAITKEKSAWRFVHQNTFSSIPLSKENWQHNPVIFLNSIGGGYCDDVAAVLTRLWKESGFKARIIGLEGHVVPEVFIDKEWQLFDPDMRVFYQDKNKNILSIKQVESNTNVLDQTQYRSQEVSPYFYQINQRYRNYYQTQKDNTDITEWALNYSEITNDFTLPSHSSLEIQFDTTSGSASLLVHLSRKSIGKLKVPLVPLYSTGQFSFKYNDSLFVASENFTFPIRDFLGEIILKKVSQNTTIQYLINPKLPCWKEMKKLSISSSEKLFIEQKQIKNISYTSFGSFSILIDQQQMKHIDFWNELSQNSPNQIDKNYILDTFEKYLTLDKPSITKTERKNAVAKLEQELLKLDNKSNLVSIIQDYHPKSLLYLYVAFENKQMEKIQQIINKK